LVNWFQPIPISQLETTPPNGSKRSHGILIHVGCDEKMPGIPFEGYDGMTQLQFQESNAPFLRHGGQDGELCLHDIMVPHGTTLFLFSE
jgi:hypothetical protein